VRQRRVRNILPVRLSRPLKSEILNLKSPSPLPVRRPQSSVFCLPVPRPRSSLVPLPSCLLFSVFRPRPSVLRSPSSGLSSPVSCLRSSPVRLFSSLLPFAPSLLTSQNRRPTRQNHRPGFTRQGIPIYGCVAAAVLMPIHQPQRSAPLPTRARELRSALSNHPPAGCCRLLCCATRPQ